MANEQQAEIFDRMQMLPDRQREVLYLRAVEELPIDEISKILGVNRNAVKASLSVARQTMRSWLAAKACTSARQD